MKRLITNTNFLVVLVLVIAIAITYVVIFLPMKEQHEQRILNNFVLLAQVSVNGAKGEDIVPFMEGVQITKIDEDYAMDIISSNMKYEWVEDGYLINEKEYISYIDLIPDTTDYWYIKIKNDILFKPIRKMSLIILFLVIGLSIMLAVVHIISIRSMRNVVRNLERSKEKYKEYAIRDALTGTYSRLFFQDWILKQPNVHFENIDSLSAIIMIDLDGFKKVNDTYGHLVGDSILTKIADILKSSVREGDYVIRFGGDEFLILLRECDIEHCENIISRIESKIKELDKYNIKMSYGIEKIQHTSRLLDYIKNADEKMYRMKREKQADDKILAD